MQSRFTRSTSVAFAIALGVGDLALPHEHAQGLRLLLRSPHGFLARWRRPRRRDRSRVPQSGGWRGAPDPEDIALSDLMSSYWVNFAASGDPNGPGLPSWPAFDEKEMKTMVFDKAPGARPLPDIEKLKAFDAYYAWRRAQAKADGAGGGSAR